MDYEAAHLFYVVILDIYRLILSLIVIVAGTTVLGHQKQYLGIVDNDLHFTGELGFCVALGVLVFVLSIAKSMASCYSLWASAASKKYFHKAEILIIELLTVMVFMNFIVSILAGVKSTGNTLENAYFESANRSFLDYDNTYIQWDHFQTKFKCCGVSGPSDYVEISAIVPKSCCSHQMLRSQNIDCSDVTASALPDDLDANRIYNQGCVESVIGNMTRNYIVAAIILSISLILLLENLVLSSIISHYLWKHICDN